MDVLPAITSQTAEELKIRFQEWNQPGYRLSQLLDWLYVQRVTDWDAMSNLPRALREKLRTNYSLYPIVLLRKQGARDTTQKFLWRLTDHSLVESVLIPANPALYGEPSDRHTLCVSTQVGCAYGCKFCASGLVGLKRNLGVEEIVEQVLAIERDASKKESSVEGGRAERDMSDSFSSSQNLNVDTRALNSRLISNLVIMGMGEPLANYDNLMKALAILNAPWGGRIGARKITISTSGLVPQIRKLAEEPLQFRLAISLHGATDEVRNKIMPVNRKFPLRELTAACEFYAQKRGRKITFEYILIGGVNDGLEQVKPLALLARRLDAKVNLIPYNQVEGLRWKRPDPHQQESFFLALQKEKVNVTLRREKGHDIDAACGQLRLRTEKELSHLQAPQ